MPYMRNNLISRSGYSGVGDWWDSISEVAGSALKVYGAGQQAQGAAAAAQQSQRDLLTALQAQQGPSMGTIMLIGGAGLVAYLLISRHKKG
jgi:hypothetical protein